MSSNQNSEQQLVYDSPTRLFHWLFAGLFVAAFLIAKVVEEKSPVFNFHMAMGIVMLVVVLFRIVWGFVGSETARWTSFPLAPSQLLAYAKSVMSRGAKRLVPGHNPASAWAAVVMILCALGLAGSGLLMKTNRHFFEEVHEVFGNVFLITAILHVAGLLFHTVKHKDPIGLSMIHGKKTITEGSGIYSARKGGALVLWVLVLGTTFGLYQGYDSATHKFHFLGLEIGKTPKVRPGSQESAPGALTAPGAGSESGAGGEDHDDDDHDHDHDHD